MANLRQQRIRIGNCELQVLRRDAIGDGAGFGQVARPDQRAAARERFGDDGRARHFGDQPLRARRDAVDQARVGRDEQRLRHLVVLGLREQIQRDPVRIGRRIGNDQHLRDAGDHVDADGAEDATLGGRDVGIARSADLVDGGDVCVP